MADTEQRGRAIARSPLQLSTTHGSSLKPELLPRTTRGKQVGLLVTPTFSQRPAIFTWSTFQLKKSKLPDHVWILPPQTSQLKLPECLCGCCSLVAVYGSPQLGQRKCSVVQRSLAMPRLCDAPSTCSSAMVCHNQRPATRMLEPGEYLISTSLTS
jgi:hypothetical protein